MEARVEALLFDLGRVLIELDVNRTHAKWAELAGVTIDHIDQQTASIIAQSEPYFRHERGQISDAQFFDFLRASFQIALSDAQFLAGWNAMFVGETPGVRDVIARTAGQVPLYAFSNTNCAHQAYWSVQFADLLAPFRKVYVSNELGARKPEAAAFQAVVSDIGLAPQNILFFDDLLQNVEGARASGLRAVQVSSVADIEGALQDVGLC